MLSDADAQRRRLDDALEREKDRLEGCIGRTPELESAYAARHGELAERDKELEERRKSLDDRGSHTDPADLQKDAEENLEERKTSSR